jgi:hypothetical protein
VRALRECGSWFWWPQGLESGLAAQIDLASKLTAVTLETGLLAPATVACRWEVEGRIVSHAWSRVAVVDGLIEWDALPRLLHDARPDGLPGNAVPGELEIAGPGSWPDAEGVRHSADGMQRLDVDLIGPYPSVYVEVYHDVWMTHDFSGNPQPEIHARNAPRLVATLLRFSEVLGVPAEPADSKYFGHAVGLGVENARDMDDIPLDVTDRIPHRDRTRFRS